jgi:hypothetical protein
MAMLSLPVRPAVPSSQPDLFPYARPETVLAYLRHAEARVLDVAPELEERDLLDLLGELALFNRRLDPIRVRIHASADYQARQRVPVVLPLPTRRTVLRD